MLHHALSSVEERISMIEKSQWGEGLSREDMERFAQYLYVAGLSRMNLSSTKGPSNPTCVSSPTASSR
jgi:hypothetical protein